MRRILLFVLLVAVAAIAWLYAQQSAKKPLIVSGFVEADQVRVGSRIGGRIAKVHVAEGARVSSGQPLFELDPFDLQDRLADAEAQLASATEEAKRLATGLRPEEIEQSRARKDQALAEYEKARTGPRPGELAIAKEQVKIAEADLELAELEFARVTKLRNEASAAATEYDEAVRAKKRSQAEVISAREKLALLEEGTRAEDIATAKARLAEAQAALAVAEQGFRVEERARADAQVHAAKARVDAIQKQVDELVVSSPCDCLVEVIDLRPGDLVAPNAPAVALLETKSLWVRTYVPQSLLSRVQLGQKLTVRIDSLPDTRFTGRVIFVASDGEFTPRNLQTPEERGKQVFRLKAQIEGDTSKLRVGMSADVFLDSEPAP